MQSSYVVELLIERRETIMLGKQIHISLSLLIFGIIGCGTAIAGTNDYTKSTSNYNPCTNVNTNHNIVSLATDDVDNSTLINQDPYENFNRHAYKLNTAIDKVIIRPVARVYQAVVPAPVAKGVTNFFINLNNVPTVINDVLQLRMRQAVSDSFRFLVNTTVGIGGLFDVATEMKIPRNYEDFGLTLANWGYTNSNFLVLPVLGPNTVRDAVGIPVNYATAPYAYFQPDYILYSTTGLNLTNQRARYLKFDGVIAQAYDPYIFERDAYLQRRNYLIKLNREHGQAPSEQMLQTTVINLK